SGRDGELSRRGCFCRSSPLVSVKRIRFVTPARQEFLTQTKYYEGEAPGLGSRFAQAVGDATARALAFPFSGSPSTDHTPSSLCEEISVYGIVVFALVHHSRRPAVL